MARLRTGYRVGDVGAGTAVGIEGTFIGADGVIPLLP